jgi:hypothetical protein
MIQSPTYHPKLTLVINTQAHRKAHIAHILRRAVLELLARPFALLEVCFVITLLGALAAFSDTRLFTLGEAGKVVAGC